MPAVSAPRWQNREYAKFADFPVVVYNRDWRSHAVAASSNGPREYDARVLPPPLLSTFRLAGRSFYGYKAGLNARCHWL